MKLLALILLILAPLLSLGQLVTNTSWTPNALVQSKLVGSGVTISNVTFNGASVALGSFTATGTNLGMTEGIVMTTGTASSSHPEGPKGPNNQEDAGIDNGAGGYSMLSNLLGGTPTYNASVLEFDFVTCSDSVSFNYVFGSEEYLEFVGSQFNDVFAFFITGPGYSSPTNIARLPGGTAVAINNVHAPTTNPYGTFGPVNAAYYVHNAGGTTIQYDGFTKKLKAEAAVQCDQTYHLVIAIADAGDPQYDSGIFLEANSLTASEPVDVDFEISSNVFGNNHIIAEGCVSTTITLERTPCNLTNSLTVPITTSGVAIEGVDYSNIPASITFPPGSSSVNFTFDAFADGITEGLESLNFEFEFTDNCGNTIIKTLELEILEVSDVEVTIEGGTVNCPGEEIELVASVTGGSQPYTYLWSTGETTSSIFVSPNSTQTYSVTVTDDCVGVPVTQTYTVIVPVIPPLVIDPIANITDICPYVPVQLNAVVNGGTPPYSYAWTSTTTTGVQSTSASYTAVPPSTTVYTVTVTDYCGQDTSTSMTYTVTSPPLVLDMSPDIEICPGDSAFISVSSTGGYGQHYYNWLHSGETTPGVWVQPSATTTYTVSVSDECQTFTVEGSTKVIVVKPTADFTATSSTWFNGMPVTFHNQSINAVDYEWTFGDGNFSDFIHPTNTYDDPGLYYVTLIAIDEKGCRDTIVKPINIEEEWWIYVPNTFTPDGDQANNDFRISTIGIDQLHVTIYNRWGELVFESNDKRFIWDGTYDGFKIQDGTFTYKIDFVTNSGREKQILGHVNILK